MKKLKTTHKINKNKQCKAEYTDFTNPCTLHTAPLSHPGYKASHICSIYKNTTKSTHFILLKKKMYHQIKC